MQILYDRVYLVLNIEAYDRNVRHVFSPWVSGDGISFKLEIFIRRTTVSFKLTFFRHKGHKPTPLVPFVWPLAVELAKLCRMHSRQKMCPQHATVAFSNSSKQIGHLIFANDFLVFDC